MNSEIQICFFRLLYNVGISHIRENAFKTYQHLEEMFVSLFFFFFCSILSSFQTKFGKKDFIFPLFFPYDEK